MAVIERGVGAGDAARRCRARSFQRCGMAQRGLSVARMFLGTRGIAGHRRHMRAVRSRAAACCSSVVPA
ncbi:hypothetical protein KCU57_17675 [Xanthomonas translucens]|uniref:hypothetical protein n=1 Tax=Xanthomonas campestris pv. translucens TaxID=343 RepID=UPI001F1C0148|nr:hypothetical protein [Xanthomonas translucens]UKE50480.1 hypothetical protein KCU57_17675 [Xanthomonas translucens]